MTVQSDSGAVRHSSPPREVSPGIWWVPECLVNPYAAGVSHSHVAPYLIVGADATLIFDTGPPAHWEDIHDRVRSIIGSRPIDWIVPSHPEVAHCGNVDRFLNTYPNSRVIGDVRDYHMYYPELESRFDTREPGSHIDLGGGYEVVLLPAPIKDLSPTQWAYETSQQVLFVGDAFGFSHHPELPDDSEHPQHLPGECTLLSSEMEQPLALDQIAFINERALYWTRFRDVEPRLAAVEQMLCDYPTRLLAPAHGSVIDNVDTIMPTIWEAYRMARRG